MIKHFQTVAIFMQSGANKVKEVTMVSLSCTVKELLISPVLAATVVGLLERAHSLRLLYAVLVKFPF